MHHRNPKLKSELATTIPITREEFEEELSNVAMQTHRFRTYNRILMTAPIVSLGVALLLWPLVLHPQGYFYNQTLALFSQDDMELINYKKSIEEMIAKVKAAVDPDAIPLWQESYRHILRGKRLGYLNDYYENWGRLRSIGASHFLQLWYVLSDGVPQVKAGKFHAYMVHYLFLLTLFTSAAYVLLKLVKMAKSKPIFFNLYSGEELIANRETLLSDYDREINYDVMLLKAMVVSAALLCLMVALNVSILTPVAFGVINFLTSFVVSCMLLVPKRIADPSNETDNKTFAIAEIREKLTINFKSQKTQVEIKRSHDADRDEKNRKNKLAINFINISFDNYPVGIKHLLQRAYKAYLKSKEVHYRSDKNSIIIPVLRGFLERKLDFSDCQNKIISLYDRKDYFTKIIDGIKNLRSATHYSYFDESSSLCKKILMRINKTNIDLFSHNGKNLQIKEVEASANKIYLTISLLNPLDENERQHLEKIASQLSPRDSAEGVTLTETGFFQHSSRSNNQFFAKNDNKAQPSEDHKTETKATEICWPSGFSTHDAEVKEIYCSNLPPQTFFAVLRVTPAEMTNDPVLKKRISNVMMIPALVSSINNQGFVLREGNQMWMKFVGKNSDTRLLPIHKETANTEPKRAVLFHFGLPTTNYHKQLKRI